MTETDFRAELKRGLRGGYLFHGEEDYLKSQYARSAKEAVLSGTFDDFNHVVLYPENFTPDALSSALETLPMMEEAKLIEVRGIDWRSMKKEDFEAVLSVLATLPGYDYAVLIVVTSPDLFDEGRLPKAPSDCYKKLTKYLTPVALDFPQASRIRSWIERHFLKEGIRVDTDVPDLLVAQCGHDMWRIHGEIAKLIAYVQAHGRDEVTEADVREVACHTVEYATFELTNAILDGDTAHVLETLRREKADRVAPILLLSTINRTFADLLLIKAEAEAGKTAQEIADETKINIYRVNGYLRSAARVSRKRLERALELCRDADVAQKSSVGSSSYMAIERLLCATSALTARNRL